MKTEMITALLVLAWLFMGVAHAEGEDAPVGSVEWGEAQRLRLAEIEKDLADVEGIERLKVIRGKGDSLKLKLYYKSGRRALFKPDHHKWRYKTRVHANYVTRPRRPEVAVYRLAKALLPAIRVVYPPVVELELTRERILALAFDDPDTDTDEVAYLKKALAKGRPYMPIAVYRDEKTGLLVGCATLWVSGKNVAPGLILAYSRKQLMKVAAHLKSKHRRYLPKTLFHQFANMVTMDMLVANNDRTSNVLFDVEHDAVRPIDNDDAFVAGRRKAFSRNLFRALTVYDADLAKALEKLFDERSDEDLANTIFASYSPKQALRYAKETRERFQKVFLRAIEKQEPIERSP